MSKVQKIILIAACAVAAAVAAGAAVYFSTRPAFALTEEAVTVEVGSSFSAEDYLGEIKHLDREEIAIDDPVDVMKLGDYQVTYSYQELEHTLAVTVVDTVAPVITVKPELSFDKGTEIKAEMLASAEDVTDCTLSLDLGGEDLAVFGKHTVTVTATDLGGNTAKKEIELEITDPDVTPPVISGVKDAVVYVGKSYDVKAGVSVTDDYDPAPVLVIDDGGLDTAKKGTYTVTYTATDASGNTSVKKATVTVKDPPPPPVKYTPAGGTVGWEANGIANQPYLVAVNRAHCTVTVYGKDGQGNYTVPVKAFACSVGRAGCETITGRYNTLERYEWHRMIDASYGRYAIRISGSYLFHSVCYYTPEKTNLEYNEYNKLGSPASLGCVRLCVRDIKWMYDNCPAGFPTVIYDDPALSGPLGKPATIKIDVNDAAKRGWDPTDWDAGSPWNQ